MPYEWITDDTPGAPKAELHLWPFRSLPRRGFVWIMGIGFSLSLIPLLAVLGTVTLWWLLPFALGAMGALWFSIDKSYRDGEILEVLKIWPERITLIRHGPGKKVQMWEANTYWVTVEMHLSDGPVPHYVTLKGSDREVEIGAFLSEAERPILYEELCNALRNAKTFA